MNSSLYSHLHFRKLSLDLSQSDGRRRPKLIRIGHLTPYKKLLQQFLLYLRHSELTATYTVDGVEKCRGGQKLYMAAKKAHLSILPIAMHLCLPLYMKTTLYGVVTKKLNVIQHVLSALVGMTVQAHTASTSCQIAAVIVVSICSTTCSGKLMT